MRRWALTGHHWQSGGSPFYQYESEQRESANSEHTDDHRTAPGKVCTSLELGVSTLQEENGWIPLGLTHTRYRNEKEDDCNRYSQDPPIIDIPGPFAEGDLWWLGWQQEISDCSTDYG